MKEGFVEAVAPGLRFLLCDCPTLTHFLVGHAVANVIDALEGRDDLLVMGDDDDRGFELRLELKEYQNAALDRFRSYLRDSGNDGCDVAFYKATHLDAVKYWIRNVEQKKSSFWLQLPHQKFYPDFVAMLNDGRILVVEYKGAIYYDAEEAKRQIGEA